MYGYGGYAPGGGRIARPATMAVNNAASSVDFSPSSAQGAALSVAVMLVGCVLFLTVLKRSNFRAVVGVGPN